MDSRAIIEKCMTVRQYKTKIFAACNKMLSLPFIYYLKLRYLYAKINIGGVGVNFIGLPVVRLSWKSTLTIGKNVIIASRKYFNPLGFNKRSIIVTLHRNAEIVIKDNVGISGAAICCANKIVIGNNVIIGANATITDTDFHNFFGKTVEEINEEELIPRIPVIIEDNVKIAMNVTILKGVTIGANSVVAANSVVVKSVPPNVLVGGNPAKVLRAL